MTTPKSQNLTVGKLIERLKLAHPDTIVEFDLKNMGHPFGWGIAGTRIEESENHPPIFILEGD